MASLKLNLNSHTQTGYYTESESNNVTGAKHSFLKISELKAMAFSHLQPKNDENLNLKCLLNVALTCKDFLEVALDALWEEMDSFLPLLKLLPALQLEDEAYILCGNVSQADWDRLQYYSRKVKFFEAMCEDDPHWLHFSTYLRIAQAAQLRSSALFPSLRHLKCSLDKKSIPEFCIFFFLSPLLDSLELSDIKDVENTIVGPFLAALSSQSQVLSRIVLRSGKMSVDILKKHIVHFKQLRFLELLNAVIMSDFVLWEVLGTLPSLANLSLEAIDPASHPAHAPENSNSQCGGPKYFEALESLSITGSFFFIQHFLGFIDSPCLKTIKVYPVIDSVHNHEFDNHFTPSMTVVTSKWSQSLRNLVISSKTNGTRAIHLDAISTCLMLLTNLHETFHLTWGMKNMDNDVGRLVMSWPKLRTLRLPIEQTFISLSTLRIIAESCPELRYLHIQLDTSTVPHFDTPSKSLRHNLEVLAVGKAHPSTITTQEYQIQVTRYLDLIFPYLKSIEAQRKDETWSGIQDLVKLCQDARRLGVK